MPLVEECRVVKVIGDYAVIELERKPECDGCKACAFNRRNILRMTARSEIPCAAGDMVSVEMPQKSIKGSYLVLFLLPLVLMLIAVSVTAEFAWYVQIPSILGALLLGLIATFLCDKLIKRKAAYMPTIKSVIKSLIIQGETNDRP